MGSQQWLARKLDDLLLWAAFHLPRRLVYWCYVRVAASATTGKYESEVLSNISMMDALNRWEETCPSNTGREF